MRRQGPHRGWRVTGLFTVAAAAVVCTFAVAPQSLEDALNGLWAMLALAAFAGWVLREQPRRHGRQLQLVSLVFVLALLFPIISANDDFALQEFAEDVSNTQSVAIVLKSDHAQPSTAQAPVPAAVVPGPIPALTLGLRELVSDAVGAAILPRLRHARGNHSPPLA